MKELIPNDIFQIPNDYKARQTKCLRFWNWEFAIFNPILSQALRSRPGDRGEHPTGAPPTPAGAARAWSFCEKTSRNYVILRHRLMPLGLTARNSAKNYVTLRHALMPLGLTSNRPADPLFQAGTQSVTQAGRQVRRSVAARGPVRPRPLAVEITENCRKTRHLADLPSSTSPCPVKQLPSFPRSAWEGRPGRAASAAERDARRATRSVEDGIPTEDRGNEGSRSRGGVRRGVSLFRLPCLDGRSF